MPNADYPFVLNTGRLQHQWHTMTKTGKIATLNKLNPAPFVEIHPEDAAELGIKTKDKVEIRSRRGYAILPAIVTDRVLPGACFAPIHWNDVFGENLAINAVTSDAIDAISQQPELKVCAVQLTRIEVFADDSSSQQLIENESNTQAAAVHILWASQTGNAEALAEKFAAQLSANWSVNCVAMDDYPFENITKDTHLLFITSTFGDGDAPDNGNNFWNQLNSDAAPSLTHLHYSLLALGDSNYANFCGHGKKLAARLTALGAKPLNEKIECDTDFETTANQWFTSLHEQLVKHLPSDSSSTTTSVTVTTKKAESGFSKTNPYLSRLIINKRLNSGSNTKDTRQFGFDLGEFGNQEGGPQYQAGDALGIWPQNCSELVTELEIALNLNREAPVIVDANEKPLREALQHNFEICRPSNEALQFIAQRSGSKELTALLDTDKKAELQKWLYGRQLVDIIHEFPIRCSLDEFMPLLKRIQPRLYSIASSSKEFEKQVHLTVSAVRYECIFNGNKNRKGVSSTFLADRAEGVDIPLFIQPNKNFRVPTDGSLPIIMVGPGTGVAPFRGFLQERRARGDSGKNWLFFGEQHAATDFYYQDELAQFQQQGVLTKLSLAFSRDQQQKIYVQDRMRENGEKIWQWIDAEGGYFYVCGDASRMAKDVDNALRDIIQQYGKFDEEETANYMRKLNMDKRYVRDVY